MATQPHHLIPNNVADTHPLFQALAAGNASFDRPTLNLPDKATAAANARSALAGDPLDTAHEGRHYKAYDNLVRAYLDEFQRGYTEPFTDSQGRLELR